MKFNRSNLSLVFDSVRYLGSRQMALYAWYRLGVASGYLAWKTEREQRKLATLSHSISLHSIFTLPKVEEIRKIIGSEGIRQILNEADEIVDGSFRAFGGDPVPIRIAIAGELKPWTEYEKGNAQFLDRNQENGDEGTASISDIKFIWETARFGWVYTLGRAYLLTGNEKYPSAFWDYFNKFLASNPPNIGPNWCSAQEVAIRLMAFVFASQVFVHAQGSTSERKNRLARAVVEHAVRIPPTLSYARAQNNNHLLSEAAGLYTAGLALRDFPEAKHWRELGWEWFLRGLSSQIAADGTYVQHSTNYHRLMLQLALWIKLIAKSVNEQFPTQQSVLLASTTRWLLAVCDKESGNVPNLGPNDSAYLFPLTVCDHQDFRPVLQAAVSMFLNKQGFEPGPWDEMALWFNDEGVIENKIKEQNHIPNRSQMSLSTTPHILRSSSGKSWAYYRIVHFTSRPGHADQLTLDLWWRGLNIARDAGTYLYNGVPPWNNSLTRSDVHNTISINGMDQMRRVGRFLYLDWAQGEVIEGKRHKDGTWQQLTAQHDGYRKIGLIHRRTVIALDDNNWGVEDHIEADKNGNYDQGTPIQAGLQWLLPDLDWSIEKDSLALSSPFGIITIKFTCEGHDVTNSIMLVSAGKLLYGSGEISPTWGWYSPFYGKKVPALSLRLTITDVLPLNIQTYWHFPLPSDG